MQYKKTTLTVATNDDIAQSLERSLQPNSSIVSTTSDVSGGPTNYSNCDEQGSTRPLRLPAQLPVELEFLSSGTCLTTFTTNIGSGGFFVELDPPRIVPKNSLISFEIEIKDTRPSAIKGEAIVRWTRERNGKLVSGMGLEFIVIAEENRDKIIDFTEKLMHTIA
jgi:hypothetical protein